MNPERNLPDVSFKKYLLMPMSPGWALDFGPCFRQFCHRDKRSYRFCIIFRLLGEYPLPTGCFAPFLISICKIQVAMGDVKKDGGMSVATKWNRYAVRVGQRLCRGLVGYLIEKCRQEPKCVTHSAGRIASTICPRCRLLTGQLKIWRPSKFSLSLLNIWILQDFGGLICKIGQ